MSNLATSDARPPLTQLSDDEVMFRDAVAAFAADDVAPRVRAMEAAGKIDELDAQISAVAGNIRNSIRAQYTIAANEERSLSSK